MKKILQILFPLFLSYSVCAQDSLTRNYKWALGIGMTPTYAFPTYTFMGEKSTNLKYGISITTKYRNIFETGVIYDYLEYQTTFDEIAWIRKDVFQYSLLSLPIIFKINPLKKRMTYSINFGLQINYLLDNNVISSRPDNVQFKMYKNGSIFLSLVFGNEISYSLNKYFTIFIAPQYVLSVSPIYYRYTSTIGVDKSFPNYIKYIKIPTGIYYNFKK